MHGAKLSIEDPRDHIIDEIIVQLIESLSKENVINQQSKFNQSPIFDQGSTSVCVASSAVTMKNMQDGLSNLNPFFLYNLRDDCASDSGMSIRNVMTLLYRFGCATFGSYSTNRVLNRTSKSAVHIDPQVLKDAARHKILGYGRIYSVETLLHIIKLNKTPGKYQNAFGALLVVLPAINSNAQFWKSNRPWINNNNVLGYHCVSIVDSVDEEKQMIRIQNSWGPNWSDNGYVFMSFQDWKDYMVECFYSTNHPDIAKKIKTLCEKFKTYKNFNNGNMEPDNQFQGLPIVTNYVDCGFAKKNIHFKHFEREQCLNILN